MDPTLYKEGGETVYILVVDDEPIATALVKFVLDKEGYDVETADNPRAAMQLIEKREPDLLLLDVRMPYLNGFEFSTKLRENGYETPLIFMTAQDTVESKLQGFRMGADDYICKPYHPQELVARVHALMRRVKQNSKIGMTSIRVGRIELFPADLKVVIDDHISHVLTHTETMVLRALMSRAGQSVSRNQILTEVWDDEENNSNIVDVYIRRLRAKLEPDSYKPRYIVSVRGIGYKFLGK